MPSLPPTEQRNPDTLTIDQLGTFELLELINDQDATVPAAVRAALPQLAELVDTALAVLRAGGGSTTTAPAPAAGSPSATPSNSAPPTASAPKP